MIAATSGQSHTSESANHSASCIRAYDSYAPANWREHIRESLKTLSLCCNTQAKNHVGTIPVPPRLGGAGHKSQLPQVSDPGTACAPPDSFLRRQRPAEKPFQNRGRIVHQRLLVSIEHFVAHRRGEGLGPALAGSP